VIAVKSADHRPALDDLHRGETGGLRPVGAVGIGGEEAEEVSGFRIKAGDGVAQHVVLEGGPEGMRPAARRSRPGGDGGGALVGGGPHEGDLPVGLGELALGGGTGVDDGMGRGGSHDRRGNRQGSREGPKGGPTLLRDRRVGGEEPEDVGGAVAEARQGGGQLPAAAGPGRKILDVGPVGGATRSMVDRVPDHLHHRGVLVDGGVHIGMVGRHFGGTGRTQPDHRWSEAHIEVDRKTILAVGVGLVLVK